MASNELNPGERQLFPACPRFRQTRSHDLTGEAGGPGNVIEAQEGGEAVQSRGLQLRIRPAICVPLESERLKRPVGAGRRRCP
jgi:hypothetical protein